LQAVVLHPFACGLDLKHSRSRHGSQILDQELKEAERELEAATRRSDVNAAAKKLMRAKEALKRLEADVAP
jgi:hypothetical protein